jgi:hypothetical protein
MSRDDVSPSAESVEFAHDPSKDERGTVRIDPIDVVVVVVVVASAMIIPRLVVLLPR